MTVKEKLGLYINKAKSLKNYVNPLTKFAILGTLVYTCSSLPTIPSQNNKDSLPTIIEEHSIHINNLNTYNVSFDKISSFVYDSLLCLKKDSFLISRKSSILIVPKKEKNLFIPEKLNSVSKKADAIDVVIADLMLEDTIKKPKPLREIDTTYRVKIDSIKQHYVSLKIKNDSLKILVDYVKKNYSTKNNSYFLKPKYNSNCLGKLKIKVNYTKKTDFHKKGKRDN